MADKYLVLFVAPPHWMCIEADRVEYMAVAGHDAVTLSLNGSEVAGFVSANLVGVVRLDVVQKFPDVRLAAISE